MVAVWMVAVLSDPAHHSQLQDRHLLYVGVVHAQLLYMKTKMRDVQITILRPLRETEKRILGSRNEYTPDK